jgi:hypothetical protein
MPTVYLRNPTSTSGETEFYPQAWLEREKQCILVLATPRGRGAVKARKIGAVCCSI